MKLYYSCFNDASKYYEINMVENDFIYLKKKKSELIDGLFMLYIRKVFIIFLIVRHRK